MVLAMSAAEVQPLLDVHQQRWNPVGLIVISTPSINATHSDPPPFAYPSNVPARGAQTMRTSVTRIPRLGNLDLRISGCAHSGLTTTSGIGRDVPA